MECLRLSPLIVNPAHRRVASYVAIQRSIGVDEQSVPVGDATLVHIYSRLAGQASCCKPLL